MKALAITKVVARFWTGRATVKEQVDRDNGQVAGQGAGHNPGTAASQAAETEGGVTRARVRLSSARPPKAPPLPRRLYDIQAIAAYLGIPVYSVRGLIWSGALPYVRIGRRQYLDLKDVDRFIESQKECEQ